MQAENQFYTRHPVSIADGSTVKKMKDMCLFQLESFSSGSQSLDIDNQVYNVTGKVVIGQNALSNFKWGILDKVI